ncbi:MAG: penicillin-binding transpeptidase domain-containing protein [Butyrivibrio sp.]|nr:penicillin-binding transpeptidase domain-containing protein [Butyrivibrio sp.]
MEKKKTGRRKGVRAANRGIFVTTCIFLAAFAGLIGYMVYFNIVRADEVINNPYNKRQGILSEKITRGRIVSADGNVIAETAKDSEGGDIRYYPYNNLFAHAVGYINNGGYGIESRDCYYMLTSNQNPFEQLVNDITGEKSMGDTLVTTLDSGLQQAACDALGGNRGAVVVTEPSTGRILAMVSKPDFNPNTLAADWDEITAENADSVLINRATQGLYPPGSTFKLVTALAYIRQNPDSFERYKYTCANVYDLDGHTISCAFGASHGEVDLRQSIVDSCNTSFINMGLSLDIDGYRDTAQKLLFNSKLPLDMEYSESSFALDHESGEWEIAQTAFGQGRTLVTPMHLAMISNAIANGGVLMKPYIADRVESVNGVTVKSFRPEEYGRLMTEEEAEILKDAMMGVGQSSFEWLFGGSEYGVACKSGTAQYGTQGYEHSFFVSFSPCDSPEISVTVLIEGGPGRDTSAAEAAKLIYDYWYSR